MPEMTPTSPTKGTTIWLKGITLPMGSMEQTAKIQAATINPLRHYSPMFITSRTSFSVVIASSRAAWMPSLSTCLI